MRNTFVITMLAAIGMLAACGDATPTLDPADAPIKARLFINELRSAQWDRAFARLTPHLKQFCESEAALAAAWQAHAPTDIELRDEAREMYGDSIGVGGSAKTPDGRAGSIGMIWEPVEGQWLLSSMEVSGRDLCP